MTVVNNEKQLLDKQKVIDVYEKRMQELEEKLSRRDAKIESLKKEIEQLRAGKK